jgi:hypothetical protein
MELSIFFPPGLSFQYLAFICAIKLAFSAYELNRISQATLGSHQLSGLTLHFLMPRDVRE